MVSSTRTLTRTYPVLQAPLFSRPLTTHSLHPLPFPQSAEAAAHRLLDVAGRSSLDAWAALAVVYRAYGEAKRAELASCEQEMARLEKQQLAAAAAAASAGVSPSPSYGEGRAGGNGGGVPATEPSTASAGSVAGSAGELQVCVCVCVCACACVCVCVHA